MAEILRVPYLGSAEEDVQLSSWLVAEGEGFARGQALLLVETLKASFEVEAERAGIVLRRLVPEGARAPMRAALAVLGHAGEELDEAWLAEALAGDLAGGAAPASDTRGEAPAPAPATEGGTRVPVAPAARRRAAELGLDPEGLPGSGPEGLVTLADVDEATAPEGRVDPAFLAELRAGEEAFAALASDEKCARYRAAGARLGEDCVLSAGALFVCECLVVGPGARVGGGCRVEARSFTAGALLTLRPGVTMRCTRIELGDNAFVAEGAEVGGGGAFDPGAELRIGSHGFVGEHAHLNPCRPLVLGDEVVVSRGAVLMTHSFGGSWLAGYPNRFAGIVVGDGCQVGIHATLFPGSEMGEGSVLLNNSALVSSVPAGRLYGGVPARDLKAAAEPLDAEAFAARARALVEDFGRQLTLRGFAVERSEGEVELRLAVVEDSARHLLRFAAGSVAALDDLPAEELRVHLRLDDGGWGSIPPEVTAIDLEHARIRGPQGPLAAAFREFLRKRGVRLHPRSWAYRGGWL